MGDVKIIDNFLTRSYYKEILKLLVAEDFEWYYRDNITGKNEMAFPQTSQFNDYGFSHTFWHEKGGPVSRFTSFIEPLLYQILDVTDCDFIQRARADMVTWSKEEFIHSAHVDNIIPNTAAVFYVNESDGDTILYNGKRTDIASYEDLKECERVSPKANRLVIFAGDLLHTGCSPTKHKRRILINSNYIKEEYKEKVGGYNIK